MKDYLQSLLKNHLGSLIGNYVFDLIRIKVIIFPKCYFVKRTFRGSNCSSMIIVRNYLLILSTKADKRDAKNMVKSEEQKHCDSSALGDVSAFALRYSTYLAITFQFLMPREN